MNSGTVALIVLVFAPPLLLAAAALTVGLLV